VVHIYGNLTARTRLEDYAFSEEDFSAYAVTTAADSGPGSLRQALADAPAGQTIRVALDLGSVIALESALPELTKSVIIEGNGVTLTRSASWTDVSETSQLLYINSDTAEVTIRRVRFKDGRAENYGGAIRNEGGNLTLESCIFDGNQTTRRYGMGGAIYSRRNDLTLRACTFYKNSAGAYYGAIGFSGSGTTLTLTGNLFYGNAAPSYPVLNKDLPSISALKASYNVVDVAFGTSDTALCGWAKGTGDKQVTTLPISGKTFKLLSGSGAAGALTALPADYPAADFYGQPIGANAAAGAVQTALAGNGYYLDLSVNNSLAGTATVSGADENGWVAGSFTITANPNPEYTLSHWLVNGSKTTSAPAALSGHTFVQAVFNRTFTVDTFTDGPDAGPGTLRYALTNAGEGDTVTLVGVTPGTTVIALESALPRIISSISIEGNGVTLTRAASWTAVDADSKLLYIDNINAKALVSRVHFKDSRSTSSGGAVRNDGNLTLESCIFSGNRITGAGEGGALWSSNTLTVRGCTFYDNSAWYGGAVCFPAAGKILTLTGNLFYGNTAGLPNPSQVDNLPVVSLKSGSVRASYNAVDLAFGTGRSQCGWDAGTGDKTTLADTTDDLTVIGDPFDTVTFAPVAALDGVLPSGPADFPATDFYGAARSFPGAPGAVAKAPNL
jgi:hypothetical protein